MTGGCAVRVLADYGCHALWLANPPAGYENVSPERFGLTARLCKDFENWADDYDRTLNSDDPASSGFPSDIDMTSFAERGLVLAYRLSAELGDGWRVTYFDLRLLKDILVSESTSDDYM